jgi:PBP1b-binding outer membrane lipoprotein LpoB
MMKKIAALIGVLLLLGGCEQSKIKSSIAEDMKDPSSVKFRQIHMDRKRCAA